MRKNKWLILPLSLLIILAIGSVVYYQSHKVTRLLYTPYGYGFKSNRISNSKGDISNFSLLDHRGDFHELYRYSDAKAIVIISQGNDCPIIQRFSNRINEIKKIFASKNIQFFLLNSNKIDSRESIIEEAKKYNYDLPILMDRSQLVAELLGITRTSEAVVIDPKDWKIVYRGAIDDRMSYGVDKQVARNNYLVDVLNSVLEDKEIKSAAVAAKGCLISFEKPASLSYEKVIAPIIKSKCLYCHIPEKGYLPLLNGYNKVKGWAQMSKETILTDRMPPFSADPLYGTYLNDSSLSPEEKRALVKWIDEGAPRDGKEDPLTVYHFKPKAMSFIDQYQKVYSVSMDKDLQIRPEGTIEYIYTQLGGAAPRDMWIGILQVHSTNPRQLHHAAMMITSKPISFYEKIATARRSKKPEEVEANRIDGDIYPFVLNSIQSYEFTHNPNYYRSQVWAAGRPQPFMFDTHAFVFIPKGSYVILESHFMGTGKAETEKTSIDFYEKKVLPKHPTQLRVKSLLRIDLNIPPYTKSHTAYTRDWTTDKDIKVISYLAHLHMRGKAAEITYTSPDKKETKKIVSIPNFYYGWHTGSGLVNKEPTVFKKGSHFIASCTYDNSAQNPNNPDPSARVPWGQRVDRSEMCMFTMGYYEDDQKSK